MMQENLRKALELDSNSVNSHFLKAIIGVWVEFDWEKGETEFLKTLELNPNHVRARILYAHLLTILRRTDEALYHGKIAQELDLLNPFTQGLYAVVLYHAGQCEAAKMHAEKGLAIEPDHYFTRMQLMNAAECLEEYITAFEMWKQNAYPVWENFQVTDLLDSIFTANGWVNLNQEVIRLHEGPKKGLLRDLEYAERCLSAGQIEKALDVLEKNA